jgi:hypothetical protein
MLAPAQLIVATGVAVIVVVAIMPVLAVAVVCAWFVTCLVALVGRALFVQVVGMLAVNTTGLEVLTLALGGTHLVGAFVDATNHGDNDNNCHCCIECTTRVSCAGWRDGAVYARLFLQCTAHLMLCFHLSLFELMAL